MTTSTLLTSLEQVSRYLSNGARKTLTTSYGDESGERYYWGGVPTFRTKSVIFVPKFGTASLYPETPWDFDYPSKRHKKMAEQEEILNLLTLQSEETGMMSSCLLTLSNEVESIITDEKARMPFHLNLLDTALEGKMRETAHSRFLWQLLRLKKILDRFITRFFPKAFSVNEGYKLHIPDKYRIDISFQTETDFFILENKVNDAQEQCGQIYRYVNHALKEGFRADHIHVLYLNSETHDAPTDYSLTKDGKGTDSLPDNVDLTVISYKDEIIRWLEDIYADISNDEVYLKTAIFQYLDYLKEKCHMSTRYTNMNNKIQSLLKEKLFTEDMNCLQRLNVISDAKEQLDQLKSHLEKLEGKQEALRFQEWFDQLVSIYPLDQYEWVRDNPYDIHIDFQYHGYNLAACLTIDGGSLCWGIKSYKWPIPQKWIRALHSSAQVFLPRAQSDDWWPAWDYTSYENGLDRYLTLIKWVLENEDREE